MNTKVIVGLGLAAIAAYLLFRKKKISAPASSAPQVAPVAPVSSILPEGKPADKKIFLDDSPAPIQGINVGEPSPSRPIEQVIEEKRLIALRAEESPIQSVEPIPSNPAIVYGGNTFADSGFAQQMQDVAYKDNSFYSNQLVNAGQGFDVMR